MRQNKFFIAWSTIAVFWPLCAWRWVCPHVVGFFLSSHAATRVHKRGTSVEFFQCALREGTVSKYSFPNQ